MKEVTGGLPRDFAPSIFIVLHMAPYRPSILPEILSRESRLPVRFALNKEPIVPGHIYIAPPDRHLLVERDHLHVTSGPREHFSRPAVNPLFRSAAQAYGDRVIGVILSGQLDDGVAGLWEIKRQGGLAVVQDPADAAYPSMPASALENIEVDHAVSIAEMPALLSRLVLEDSEMKPAVLDETPEGIHPVDITCPDCRGGLSAYRYGPVTEYRCRVGHAHSAASMTAPHREAQERALWAALVALEEGSVLSRHLADSGRNETYAREAEDKARHAETLRALITNMQDSEPPEQPA